MARNRLGIAIWNSPTGMALATNLMQYFNSGWDLLRETLENLSADQLGETVKIRGQPHTLPEAIQRSIAHLAYHTGQILLIARIVHGDDQSWQWLTIKPGGSQKHNESTWGTAASRGRGWQP